MSKLLICPDIHGRTFWKKESENIDKYDKFIFLGDYLDPYNFEHIIIPEALDNFKEIIEFKQKYNDKVILLLGNHDMPYFSSDYFNLNYYHSRHSKQFHDDISEIFDKFYRLFQLTYAYDDIIFSHAGIQNLWLEKVIKPDSYDIRDLSKTINDLLKTNRGLQKLYCVTDARGGFGHIGSCIWADIEDMLYDYNFTCDKKENNIYKYKQIFGHSLQAYYDKDMNIKYGSIIEFENCKMLDNTYAYELDTENFTVKQKEKED